MSVTYLLDLFKKELRFSQLNLAHERSTDFQISQWKRFNKVPFWLIRLALFGYVLISLLISIVFASKRGRNESWGIFLTSINHLLVTIYLTSCAVQSTLHIWQTRKDDHGNSGNNNLGKHRKYRFYAKVHWLTFNVGINVCTFVFIAYWSLIFVNDNELRENKNPTYSYMTIDRHGINWLLLLLDFSLSRTPVRLLHFVYPSCVLLLYFISNVIYWACTNDLVYGEVLDYERNTGKAVGLVVAAVFVISPLIQLALFLLYVLKKKLSGEINVATDDAYELADHKDITTPL